MSLPRADAPAKFLPPLSSLPPDSVLCVVFHCDILFYWLVIAIPPVSGFLGPVSFYLLYYFCKYACTLKGCVCVLTCT